MIDDDRFIELNSVDHVRIVNPPAEVNEIELMRLKDLIADEKTIGVFAVVVQRPAEEIPERLKVHQQFVTIRTDALTLLSIAQRAVLDQRDEIDDLIFREEPDA